MGEDAEDNLVELVRSNSEYFDKLVDLIHPRFYIPADDSTEKPWAFSMSKKQKEVARKKSKENLKKARRDRLDPEKFATTTQLLQRQNAEEEQSDDKKQDEVAEEPFQGPAERVKSSVELRARLHKRIESIRAQRLVNKARDWQKKTKTKNASKKRKKSDEVPAPVSSNKRQKQQQQQNEEPVPDLEFSRVKIDSQKRAPKKSKEKLLEKATKLQKELQDPAKATELNSKHSWDAAVSRASGEKVYDNPKLIKQSLKRDQQRRDKSAQKWQERNDAETQRAEEKQQTRSTHIKERNDARKQHAIAKREKKLMRPGFEGRKAGFLNKKK